MRNQRTRRNRFRSNDRGYRRNGVNGHSGHRSVGISNEQSRPIFLRSNYNNHNASKLFEKYTNLAKEALSTGDKILSENYFQHADHFSRVLTNKNNEQSLKKESADIKAQQNISVSKENTTTDSDSTKATKTVTEDLQK